MPGKVESIRQVLRESLLKEANDWDGRSTMFGHLPSQDLYFSPVEKLKNGNYKGYMVDVSSGRPKKAKQTSMNKRWWSESWKIISQSEVPKTVLSKFSDKIELQAQKASEPKAAPTPVNVKSPDKLLTQRQARVGLRVDTDPESESSSWVIRRMTNKSVTIGSDSGVDVGPKFAGRTFMYRWDGTGFVRQKQYLYAV